MNRYVNDNSGYIKICRYICCLYRFNSFVTCDYVSSDTGRQRTVRAVSDVLYIWKFLYYKYCVCSPAFAYFRFLGTCIVYCCTRDSDLEQGEQGFSKRTLHKDRNYLQENTSGKYGNEGGFIQSL